MVHQIPRAQDALSISKLENVLVTVRHDPTHCYNLTINHYKYSEIVTRGKFAVYS